MFSVGVTFHLPVIGQQPPRLLPVGAEAPAMMFVLRIQSRGSEALVGR